MGLEIDQLPASLRSRLRVTGECWLWTGSANAGGYGRYYSGKRMTVPHRVAYEALIGPIPEGLTLDHLCCTPPCCNPAHLEPVTMQENIRRAKAKITHCVKGHPLSGANLIRRPDGRRECRTCAIANRLRYEQSRGLIADSPRATCSCGKVVMVRPSGGLRKHRTLEGDVCLQSRTSSPESALQGNNQLTEVDAAMSALPDVRPGDVWRVNDPRGGPTIRVERVCTDWCDQDAGRPGKPHAHVVTIGGGFGARPRRIRLTRFRNVRNGYRRIGGAE